MNEPSLNDSKKLWVLALFKCLLVNLLQNVVRAILSAGGPNDNLSVLTTLVSKGRHCHWDYFHSELLGQFRESDLGCI